MLSNQKKNTFFISHFTPSCSHEKKKFKGQIPKLLVHFALSPYKFYSLYSKWDIWQMIQGGV